jgi:hypothetical protein
MAWNTEVLVKRALRDWEKARGYHATGRSIMSAHTYIKGLGRFFSITVRGKPDPSIYFAFAAMAREAAQAGNRGAEDAHGPQARSTVKLARIALAASHLMDPADGDPRRVADVVKGDSAPMFKRVVDGAPGPPLTPGELMEGVAASRVLLAELLLQHRGSFEEKDRWWVVGSGGWVNYLKEQTRFQHAMLPSCVGLDLDEEMTLLAEEAVSIYTNLGRSGHACEASLDHASDVLAEIREALVL